MQSVLLTYKQICTFSWPLPLLAAPFSLTAASGRAIPTCPAPFPLAPTPPMPLLGSTSNSCVSVFLNSYIGDDPTDYSLFLEMYYIPGRPLTLAAQTSPWDSLVVCGIGPRPSSFLTLHPSLGDPSQLDGQEHIWPDHFPAPKTGG